MKNPRRSKSLDYEPSPWKKLLPDLVPEGLESDCRTRVSEWKRAKAKG
jgi:hypothetical protein